MRGPTNSNKFVILLRHSDVAQWVDVVTGFDNSRRTHFAIYSTFAREIAQFQIENEALRLGRSSLRFLLKATYFECTLESAYRPQSIE